MLNKERFYDGTFVGYECINEPSPTLRDSSLPPFLMVPLDGTKEKERLFAHRVIRYHN